MRRKLFAEIYHLAWPVLIAQLAVMAYGVIDTLMAGRYGTEDLAAVGIATSIYFSVFVGLMGVLLAITPTVAQLVGAQRPAEIGEEVRQGMWLTLVLSLASIVVFRFPEPLLDLSQAPPALAEKVRAYLAVAAWGVPAGLGFRLFASYTTGVALPRVMMALNLLGLAFKIPLNWIFIFGHWGAPELGATGCALATTLVNWLVCVLAWLYCVLAPAYRPHRVFARWSWPRWRVLRRLLALGIPIGGSFLVDVTAFTFMALFIARLGAVMSAAHQIAANVAAVMYMLPLAIGSAVGVLVGQAVGARDFARARLTGLVGIGIGFGFAVACALALAAGAPAVAAVYSTDTNVQAVAAMLLVLVGGYHLFDALQAVTINALRGYKRVVVALVVNVVGLWLVGLAGGYAIGLTDALRVPDLGLDGPLGVRGFWIAAMIGMALASACIFAYFLFVSAPGRARSDADVAPAR